jgi:hypothetical protein
LRHHLLEFLLLLFPEVVLLVVALAAGVILVSIVVLLGGEVELPSLGTVGDKVCGVTALEAAPRRSPSLLAKHVQGTELSRKQDDLFVCDAHVLLIRSCDQRGQSKLQSR